MTARALPLAWMTLDNLLQTSKDFRCKVLILSLRREIWAGVLRWAPFLEWRRSSGLHPHGHTAVFVARGSDRNLHVLTEGGEKIHEALDGEGTSPVAHQGGDAGLLDAEDSPCLHLSEAALLDEAVNLEREAGFQQFLFGVREPEISEDVSAALL